MSTIYNKSNIEIKAKELLHSLQRTCPDGVWQELSLQLNEDFKGSGSKFTSKLFSPKVLIISLVIIGVITLALLKFTGNLDFTNKNQNMVVAPQPAPAPPPVKKETPPPPKPVAIDSARIKDSLARIAKANEIVNHTDAQATQHPLADNNTSRTNKIDSAALKRYYARMEARRHRRDSIEALRKANEGHDTATHPRRHHAHDSVISIKTDTVR